MAVPVINVPAPAPAVFKWSKQSYHLTYRSHVDHQLFMGAFLRAIGVRTCTHWSLVCESADENDPYEHSHFLFSLDKAGNWLSPAKLDFNGIHPNVKSVDSDQHWHNTWSYHEKAPVGEITRSDPKPAPVHFHTSYIDFVTNFKGTWQQLLTTPGAMGAYICRCRVVTKEIFNSRFIVPSINNFVPRPWQQAVLDFFDAPVNERQVMFIVDAIGNSGKSFFTRYLLEYKNAYVSTGGNFVDNAYAYDRQPIAVFDICRADRTFQYPILESLKNGFILSTKFVPELKRFAIPHVLVFSNYQPDLSKLSRDRFKIIDLADEPVA